jgi:spermidine synthase
VLIDLPLLCCCCTALPSCRYHLEIIKSLAAMCREVFVGGSVQYAFTTIPTYPSGQIGFMVCTKAAADGGAPLDPREPRLPAPAAPEGRGYPPLRYYSHDVHRAAFVLPAFAKEALAGSLTF